MATTEVEATLAMVNFIQEVNVYGVAVPGEYWVVALDQNKNLVMLQPHDGSPHGLSGHREAWSRMEGTYNDHLVQLPDHFRAY